MKVRNVGYVIAALIVAVAFVLGIAYLAWLFGGVVIAQVGTEASLRVFVSVSLVLGSVVLFRAAILLYRLFLRRPF